MQAANQLWFCASGLCLDAAAEINRRRIIVVDHSDARENHDLSWRRRLPVGTAQRRRVRKRDDSRHHFVPLRPVNGISSHSLFMADLWLMERERAVQTAFKKRRFFLFLHYFGEWPLLPIIHFDDPAIGIKPEFGVQPLINHLRCRIAEDLNEYAVCCP